MEIERGAIELLGDALSLFLTRDMMVRHRPQIPKYKLHALEAVIESNAEMRVLARTAGLSPTDATSKGLSRAWETHLGSVYLEQGIDAARHLHSAAISARFNIDAMAEAWTPHGVSAVYQPGAVRARRKMKSWEDDTEEG